MQVKGISARVMKEKKKRREKQQPNTVAVSEPTLAEQ
jgi:hypothetical protein